ncbi:MAG: hypothetical protein K9N35_00685 [Candidatus Marinimicrobia bacterium]|nr:hypothetical protein [Candidatus Neomarinimicrobiota bacterium]
MEIEYTVSQDGLNIETFPKGVLDLPKTLEYFDRLQNDSKIKPGAIEIVYFKNVTDFKISFSESKEIPKSYQSLKEIQKIIKTVFVCETDLAYGIGRMLQTFHEQANPNHKVTVVRSEKEIESVQRTDSVQ